MGMGHRPPGRTSGLCPTEKAGGIFSLAYDRLNVSFAELFVAFSVAYLKRSAGAANSFVQKNNLILLRA